MKLKIVNMKKFIRTILLLISLIIVLLFIGLNNTYSKGDIQYKEEYIYQGDTLWSIAQRESKENKYYENKDIRDIVQEIKNVNNIGNSDLKVGQKVLIPNI